MMELQIQSNANPTKEWRIRNRLGDINFRLRDKQISQERAIELAQLQAARWQVIEPATDFIVVLGDSN